MTNTVEKIYNQLMNVIKVAVQQDIVKARNATLESPLPTLTEEQH
jgi:hypothetical protein